MIRLSFQRHSFRVPRSDRRLKLIGSVLTGTIVFGFAHVGAANGQGTVAAWSDASICTTPRAGEFNQIDYRTRFSTSFLKWSIEDINRNHYYPALNRMNTGDYSGAALADLTFILDRWPNHYPALQALMRFANEGGKLTIGRSVACYLTAATRFAGDDANLPLLEGTFHFANGDYSQSETAWQRALSIDQDLTEAHYNLGLLYAKRSEYEKARVHARLAYSAGFPLPGLRDELKRVGRWSVDSTSE